MKKLTKPLGNISGVKSQHWKHFVEIEDCRVFDRHLNEEKKNNNTSDDTPVPKKWLWIGKVFLKLNFTTYLYGYVCRINK